MKASELFDSKEERDRIKKICDMFNGKITAVKKDGKYLFESIDKSCRL